MAKEIRILEGDGDGRFSVFMLYPIATPKTYVDGGGVTRKVVPTPAPEDGLVAALLSTAEKAALSAGDAAYSILPYGPAPDRTLAGHRDELRAIYEREKTRLTAWYQSRYAHVGVTIDAE